MTSVGDMWPGRVRSVRQELWETDALVRAITANLLAFALLIASWHLTRRSGVVADQLPWLCLGAGGLVVAGVANARWLLAGRAGVGRRRMDLLAPADGPFTDEPVPVVDGTTSLVATPSGSVYHRAECPMIGGRATRAAGARSHTRAGRRPCPVCQP